MQFHVKEDSKLMSREMLWAFLAKAVYELIKFLKLKGFLKYKQLMVIRYKKKNLLFYFLILQIFSFSSGFSTLAESPKNYLKGKFYKSVKDHFLVATEKMIDDRFKKTVIVMLDNDEDGSLGLVVNKPIGSVPLRFLINNSQDLKNEKKELYNVNVPIFWGGPVSEEQIYVLHSKDYSNKVTENHGSFSITRNYLILFDIAENKGPKSFLIILGYSGWGDGQLEGEMETDHWILSELDTQIIFEKEPVNKWLKAYENSFIRL